MQGLDLQVREGETVGLAGMEGSGQSLLLQACAGLVPTTGGRVSLDDEDLTGKTYHQFQKTGSGLCAGRPPRGRPYLGPQPDGALPARPAEAGPLHRPAEGRGWPRNASPQFNIRGTADSPVESLSGGNQQRALLALVKPEAQ